MSDFNNNGNNNNNNGGPNAGSNTSTSLRPPSTSGAPNQGHPMGSAPIGRSSSPIGSNPGRYSLGGTSSGAGKPMSTPSEHMLRKAQQHGGMQDGLRSPSAAAHNIGAGSGSISASASLARFGPRPSSEMLGMGSLGGHASVNAEQDAIDKWFEDLQHYEATLEEMAAASLDQNFKEELSAIEQWFRVLSEAERTAALYSLLQESTQVQIRFFITVLQQMARSDPMSALLSPNSGIPMAEQMEAKFASLGLKSPTAMKVPASPSARAFHRQSDAYLSPNTAQFNFSPGAGSDAAAAMLAAQRAKLKANRVSAPGTFTGDQRNFSGGGLDQVSERAGSPNPAERARSPGIDSGSGNAGMRPKSIDVLGNATAGGASNAAAGAGAGSPRRSGPLDDQLSPVPTSGNWSSMVNTPLNNMFDDGKGSGGGQANVNLDAATTQLAGLGDNNRGVTLDPDVSKYQRRKSGQPGYDQSHHSNQKGSLSPNLGGGWSSSVGGGQNDFLRQAMATSPNPSGSLSSQFPNFQTMSPNSFAGLQSPSGGFGNGLNMQMMNAMAAMGGLNNVNAAQFLAMQQQILQNQQQIAAMAAAAQQQQQGMRGGSTGQRGGGGLAPGASLAGRRSPAPGNSSRPSLGGAASSAQSGTAGSKNPTAGAAAGAGGEEEVPDLSVLNDVPTWLRHLRLHKYTPNFESSNWKDMVVMTDSDLESHGVAALGARRKLLKTFRAVREKHGIKGAEDGENPGDGAKAVASGATAAEGKEGSAGADAAVSPPTVPE
ncbi:unnamed protein product [Parajaminaea phylloscopi]